MSGIFSEVTCWRSRAALLVCLAVTLIEKSYQCPADHTSFQQKGLLPAAQGSRVAKPGDKKHQFKAFWEDFNFPFPHPKDATSPPPPQRKPPPPRRPTPRPVQRPPPPPSTDPPLVRPSPPGDRTNDNLGMPAGPQTIPPLEDDEYDDEPIITEPSPLTKRPTTAPVAETEAPTTNTSTTSSDNSSTSTTSPYYCENEGPNFTFY
ncbi:hypothetical protein OSTOST_23992 [Ostertagia ostertagi]